MQFGHVKKYFTLERQIYCYLCTIPIPDTNCCAFPLFFPDGRNDSFAFALTLNFRTQRQSWYSTKV